MTIRKTLSSLCFCVVLSFAASAIASNGGQIATKSNVGLALAAQSNGAFIENAGQWDASASFMMPEPGLNFWITQAGPVLDFHKTVPATRTSPQKVQGDVVRMTFQGAKPVAFNGSNPVDGAYNYFIGSDPSQWATNVKRYSQVTSTDIYDGIGVRYSTQNNSPRYDLILKPGADASQISIKIDGVSDAEVLTNGDLKLQTSVGSVVETGLAAYQQNGASLVQVPCHMELDGSVLKFDLGAYDATKSLIIDPLVYSTYFAPLSEETTIRTIALDKASNVVVAGTNEDGALPITTGAYETTAPATTCAFVGKLYPELSKVVYCTYFGGKNGLTEAYSVAIGGTTGDPVIVGATDSASLPVTADAFQKTDKNSSVANTAFVTKLNSTGTALVFSTYLGGSGSYYYANGETATCVKLDSAEEPVVVGTTASSDFPVSTTAYQKTLKTFLGASNAFVTKLNAAGSALVFSTYFGGSGSYNRNAGEWASETVNSLALDANEEPVFCGKTASGDLPLSSTAYQKVNLEFPNSATAYVAKLNATGSALVFSTYLGGTGNSHGGSTAASNPWGGEEATGVALMSSVNPVVVGATLSSNFPVTGGAYQTTNKAAFKAGGNGFITELNSTGSGLVFSTYLGGSYDDGVSSVNLNGTDIVVAGDALSEDFPVTSGAIQTKLSGTENAFVTELNSAGSSVLYSTFLGGNSSDSALTSTINSSGLVYLAGATTSSDFPTTSGSLFPVYEPIVIGQIEPGFISALELTSSTAVLSNFSVEPTPVAGGYGATGRVYISNSLSSNAAVAISGTGPVTFPASVVIPAGSISIDFPVDTKGVAAATSVVFTATYGAKSLTSTLVVDPATVLAIEPSTLNTTSGASITAYLILKGEAGPSGTVVKLSTTAKAPFTVPATVTVPPGKTYVAFTLKAATVTAEASGQIVATLGATVTDSTYISVEP